MNKRYLRKELSFLLCMAIILSLCSAVLAEDGPVDLNAAEALAQNVAFADTDGAAGKLGGTVTWQKAENETGLTDYVVCLTTGAGVTVTELGRVPVNTEGSYTLEVPAETSIPEGATRVAVFSATSDAVGTAGTFAVFTDYIARVMETLNIYVSPTGNDAAGTGSIDQPLATLSAAFANAAEGATITLRGGDYTGDALLVSGKKNITVCGYAGETAVVRHKIQFHNCVGIALQDFQIDAPTTALIFSGTSGNNNAVLNMDIVGRVYLSDTYRVTVANSRLHGNYGETAAVTLYYARYCMFYNNVFYNNAEYGVYILESANGSAIYNNTFYGSGARDILVRKTPSTSLIKNNIFTKGLDLASAANATSNAFDNNLYDAALAENAAVIDGNTVGFAALQALGAVEANGRLGDPKLADPEAKDFHLSAGSAAINAGTAVIGTSDGKTVGAPVMDFYGAGREFPDIGAAEYQAAVVSDRLPENVAFTDADSEMGKIGGDVTWEAADNEADITAYGLFYLLSDGTRVAITDVAKGTYTYTIPIGTSIPEQVVKIEVVAKTASGYDEVGVAVDLHDTAAPTLLAGNVLLVDDNLAKGAVSGTVSWSKASSEADITGYEVYLTDASGEKLLPLGSVPANGAGAYSLPVTVGEIPADAMYVTVFSVNVSGSSLTGASFRFFDASSNVIYVAVNGSEENDGTLAHPLSYDYAAVVAPDESTLYLRGGAYDVEATFLKKTGIMLAPYENEQPVITKKTLFNQSSRIQVCNLTFRAADNKYVLQANASSDVTVSSLSVRGAIYMSGVTGNSISNCAVTGSVEEGGITLYGAKNGKVFNNLIYANTKKGIYLLGSGTSDNLIAYNSFYGNTTADFLINSIAQYGTAASNTIRNNIFTKEFELGSETAITGNAFNYNLYAMLPSKVATIAGEARSFADIQALGAETNGLNGNAGYYNAEGGDLRLTSGSSAIGKGIAIGEIAADFTGAARGTTPDIGAYTYDESIENALQVLDKTPTGVSEYPDVSVSATFSEALAAPEQQPENFLTVTSASGSVAGRVTISGAKAVFTPLAELAYDTTYTVTLKSGIKAAGGRTLAQDVSWSFKVRSASAAGRDYYVAPNGKDDNPGTIEAPMRDITAVSAMLQPGDRMILRGGTYDGFILIWGKGSPDSDPIVVKNYDGEEVYIINTVEASRNYILYVGVSYNVRISGLIATNEGSYVEDAQTLNYGMYVHQSKNVTIDHCTFYEGTGGLLIRENSENVTVHSNVFHDQDWRYGGITMYNGVKNSNFYNNLFYDNYYGIQFYGGQVQNNNFYNNTFYNNLTDVYFASNSNAVLTGNAFESNIFSAPFLQDGSYVQSNSFNHNLYNSDKLPESGVALSQTFASWQTAGFDTDGRYASAGFVNPEAKDFTLLSGSAAVGLAGDRFELAVDFNDATRGDSKNAGAFNALTGRKWYVSAVGSDTASGTAAQPFQTIGKAVSSAGDGDIILVDAGTYAGSLDIRNKTNLTIQASGDAAVLTGPVAVAGGSGVVFDGLTWSPSGENAFTVSNSASIALRRMILEGNVTLSGAQGFTAERSLFRNGRSALTLDASSNGSVVNNQFLNASVSGLTLAGNSTGNLVINNTFYSSVSEAKDVTLSTPGQTGNLFKNNIFSSGLWLADAADLTQNTWNYNLYSNALGAAAVVGVGTTPYTFAELQGASAEGNGLTGNAQFADVSTGDLRITYYSAARGKGASIDAPAVDYHGVSRTRPVDIGAFSYSGIAKTYYVAPNGDDAAPGTLDAPLKTISMALSMAQPMESIIIRGGTYHETLSLSGRTGTPTGYLLVKAYDGENVVVDGRNMLENGLTITDSSYVRVENLNFTGFTGSAMALSDTTGIVLNTVSLDGGATGLKLKNAASTNIEGVKVSGGGASGIVIEDGSGTIIGRTFVSGRTGAAIEVKNTDGLRVASSILTGSGTGLSLAGSTGAVVYNNTFYGNGAYDLAIGAGSTGLTAKNNIFGSEGGSASVQLLQRGSTLDYNHYARADAAVDSGSVKTLAQMQEEGVEANATSGDVMFYGAENGDFDLRRGSPAIGSGVSDSNTPGKDFDGSSFMAPVDRGARFSPLSYRTLYVAPDGDDKNDGSFESPFKTVYKGMQSLKPSDTLYIREGRYSERVNIDFKYGAAFRGETLGYTVESYPGEIATFDSDDKQNVGIKFTNSSHWTLKNLQFTEYTGAAVWAAQNSSYITMDNLRIWDISDPNFIQSGVEGILGDGGSYCIVRNCEIYDIGLERMSMADHAIYIGYSAHHWTIDSNRLYNIPGGAIQISGAPTYGSDSVVTNNVVSDSMMGISLMGTKRTVVSNNTLVNNWYNDIYIDYSTQNCIIQNNIFYNTLPTDHMVRVEDRENMTTKEIGIQPAIFGIFNSEAHSNTIRYNLYHYHNFDPAVRCLTEQGINGRFIDIAVYSAMFDDNTFQANINADPKFVSLTDFRLQAGSPAIKGGIRDKMPGLDYEGKTRTNPDIGAFAYAGGSGGEGTPSPVITGGGGAGSSAAAITLPGKTPGGSVTLSGDGKTITITPDAGYEIEDVLIDGKSVGAVESYTFTDEKNHTVFVKFKKISQPNPAERFIDITGHWAEKEIRKAVENGLFDGVSATLFDPDGTMTRGMAAAVLGRMAGVDTARYPNSAFNDVDSKQYYSPFVAWAKEAGIVDGIGGSLFAPESAVTREQFAKMAAGYAKYAKLFGENVNGESRQAFADDGQIGDWAKESVYLLKAAGVLEGRPGNRFDPKAPLTRAEAAKILNLLNQ